MTLKRTENDTVFEILLPRYCCASEKKGIDMVLTQVWCVGFHVKP